MTVTWNGTIDPAKNREWHVVGGLPQGWDTNNKTVNGGTIVTSKNETVGVDDVEHLALVVTYDGNQLDTANCTVTLKKRPSATVEISDATIQYGQSGNISVTITWPVEFTDDAKKGVTFSH